MKAKNSFKNAASALIGNAIAILVKFIAQRFFIHFLGLEYLGVNGLFTNIASALSIVELGMSSAVIYNLYEPFVHKKYPTVRALMRFYQKAYRYILLATVLLGLAIMPFLGVFVHEEISGINLYLVYALFIINTATSYVLSYRRAILYASQKGYLITNIHTLCLAVGAALQIALLAATQNYYLYLIAKIATQLLENALIYRLSNRQFPWLNTGTTQALSKRTQADIFQKIRALFLHKVAGFVVSGTDNIVISMFLNITTVGLYSNYYMIISALELIFGQAITALTPTAGHILVAKNPRKNFQAFRKVRLVNFLIASITAVCLYLLAGPFIRLWLGAGYLLPETVLLVLTVGYFQRTMRSCFMVFKEAAGIYYEDRFVPIIESLVNIVASVILVQLIGLPGVFIGTILSSLVLWCYSYPKYVYRKLFQRSYRQYFLESALYLIIFAGLLAAAVLLTGVLH